MNKTIVLDTNVLLQSPEKLDGLTKENKVVVPLVVLEEIDNLSDMLLSN